MDLAKQINDRLPPWARRGILTGLCGSHVHGTYIEPSEKHGTDDQDVFQIVAHPKSHYLGLEYFRHAKDTLQTHGESLDIVVHELVKFISLCAQGNPNVNTYLWLQPPEYVGSTEAGDMLIAARDIFLSRRMFASFGGYAYAQLKKMSAGAHLGYMGAKRKELMGEYGYDIKNASHCLRLLYTAIRLCRGDGLVVRLDGKDLENVLDVKMGLWTKGMVEREAASLDVIFRESQKSSQLPQQPDASVVDRLIRQCLEAHWDTLKEPA